MTKPNLKLCELQQQDRATCHFHFSAWAMGPNWFLLFPFFNNKFIETFYLFLGPLCCFGSQILPLLQPLAALALTLKSQIHGAAMAMMA
jgi:hypothetical protein